MSKKTLLDRKTLRENLVDLLPVEQRGYMKTQAYEEYCNALWDYLQSDFDEKADKKQALQHAKEIFEDMTRNIPEPISQDPIFKGLKQEYLQ